MKKDIIKKYENFLLKNSGIIFVCLAVLLISGTLVFAIRKNIDEQNKAQLTSLEEEKEPEATEEPDSSAILLAKTDDEALISTVVSFYAAQEAGDENKIVEICPEISDKDLIRYLELSDYVEKYDSIEVYCKPGLTEKDILVYVLYKVKFEDSEALIPGYQTLLLSADENGVYFVRREETYSEEEQNYIFEAATSDEVADFNNRVTVEYNTVLEEYPEVINYVYDMNNKVNASVGEKLAQKIVPVETPEPEVELSNPDGGDVDETLEPEETPEPEHIMMKLTETVNIRNSDSQEATKLGSAKAGTTCEVIEVLLNGWAKVLYDGTEGYIKTEYLEKEAGVSEFEVQGVVRSDTNVNVRAAASQDAEKLGVLRKGSEVQFLGEMGEWSRINFEGSVGFVKTEFVEVDK